MWSRDIVQRIPEYLVLTRANYLPIGYFRYTKIQPDNEAQSTQTKEMNKHVIQFPLFVSSRPRRHAEFQYIENRPLTLTWMSNIKDVRCKPRRYDLKYGRHVVERCRRFRRFRRRAHAPSIHAVSHFDHETRVAWLCDSVPRVMVLAWRHFGRPELCYK